MAKAIAITVRGISETRGMLDRFLGKAKSDEVLGGALAEGARIYGRTIVDAFRRFERKSPRRKTPRRNWKRIWEAVKIAQKARPRKTGPVYFSAANRKPGEGAPQARWLHRGTKRQPARPEIFDSALRKARPQARRVVMEILKQAVDRLAASRR